MNQSVLKKHYNEQIAPELMKQFNLRNRHEVPAVTKIVINSGIDASADKNHLKYVTDEITKISGQSPVVTRAKLSISNFKLREGQPIGVKVTLRGAAMYEFLFKLVNVALPCIRDFRGVPSKLDGRGNYTLGIADHSIFPEVSVESAGQLIGMDVCMTTSAENDEQGRALLKALGMPFRKSSSAAGADASQQPSEAAAANA